MIYCIRSSKRRSGFTGYAWARSDGGGYQWREDKNSHTPKYCQEDWEQGATSISEHLADGSKKSRMQDDIWARNPDIPLAIHVGDAHGRRGREQCISQKTGFKQASNNSDNEGWAGGKRNERFVNMTYNKRGWTHEKDSLGGQRQNYFLNGHHTEKSWEFARVNSAKLKKDFSGELQGM